MATIPGFRGHQVFGFTVLLAGVRHWKSLITLVSKWIYLPFISFASRLLGQISATNNVLVTLLCLDFWSILYWKKDLRIGASRLVNHPPGWHSGSLFFVWRAWDYNSQTDSKAGMEWRVRRQILLPWLNPWAQMHCRWSVSFHIYSTHDADDVGTSSNKL